MFSLLDLPTLPALRTVEVLDIGARLEGTPRWAALHGRGVAHVTAFEPQAEDRKRLESLVPGIACLPQFLGDGEMAAFHLTRWPGNCSLFEPDVSVVDAFNGLGASSPEGNFHVLSTETVQTTRLDDVSGVPPPDFIKLDIQGSELNVLLHGRETLRRALVVECEALFVPLYHNQPLFGDLQMQMLMRTEGFLFHRFKDLTGRSYRPFPIADPSMPVSQPLWADAIFIRDPVRLAAWTAADLVIGAILLHDLYASFDLALRLLSEHDARTASNLAAHYVAMLQQALPLSDGFVSVAHRPAAGPT
jgi:FkbM family methyltransferase